MTIRVTARGGFVQLFNLFTFSEFTIHTHVGYIQVLPNLRPYIFAGKNPGLRSGFPGVLGNSC